MSNRQLYNTWSHFYDTYPNPTVAIDDLSVPPFYENVLGQHVLDIGCGTGRHSLRFVAQNCDVTGLDLSEGMLEQAAKKIASPLFHPVRSDFFTYIKEHTRAIEAGEAKPFDFAIMSLALEHFPSPDPVFADVAKILKSAGQFLITEIHPARSSQGALAHFKIPGSDEELHLEGFSHSETTIREAATKNGFSLETVRDFVGTDLLAQKQPKWSRYKDVPMVQMWIFRKDR